MALDIKLGLGEWSLRGRLMYRTRASRHLVELNVAQ